MFIGVIPTFPAQSQQKNSTAIADVNLSCRPAGRRLLTKREGSAELFPTCSTRMHLQCSCQKGNDHFCDTTERASQRLSPCIKWDISLYHRSGDKPLGSTTRFGRAGAGLNRFGAQPTRGDLEQRLARDWRSAAPFGSPRGWVHGA